MSVSRIRPWNAYRLEQQLGQRAQVGAAISTLFLLAGVGGRLPSAAATLLARRSGNGLDLVLLGFLGFPVASLLALAHVDLSRGLCRAIDAIFHIDAAGMVRAFLSNS